jgi:hypothetical protein
VLHPALLPLVMSYRTREKRRAEVHQRTRIEGELHARRVQRRVDEPERLLPYRKAGIVDVRQHAAHDRRRGTRAGYQPEDSVNRNNVVHAVRAMQ